MVSQSFRITNAIGIHMKPAEMLVLAIKDFDAETTVHFKGMDINAKSIMILMAACIRYGDEIEVSCEGPDEKMALQAVAKLIQSEFEQ